MGLDNGVEELPTAAFGPVGVLATVLSIVVVLSAARLLRDLVEVVEGVVRSEVLDVLLRAVVEDATSPVPLPVVVSISQEYGTPPGTAAALEYPF